MHRVLFFVSCFSVSLLGQNGQLNVSVKDETGVVVPGALVTISARPIYHGSHSTPQALTYAFTGKTGPNGVLALPDVPAGPYAVCGRVPGSLLVDSCSWSDNPLTTFVSAGTAASAAIVLKKGARIVVQISDNNGLLASELFSGHKLRVTVGTAGGQRVPMIISQKAPLSRQFSAVVPVDTDLKLQVRSETLQLAAADGSKLDMNNFKSFIPLRVAAATAPALALSAVPQVQLGVVGLR